MSKTRILLHIVFATRFRQRTITDAYKRNLYEYIFGLLRNKKCFVHRINGMSDHIHLLIDLNPTIAVADLVKDIKQSATNWINKEERDRFFAFEGWGKGYYAMSVGMEGFEECKEYIKNQETHHRSGDVLMELEWLARRHGMKWYEDDLD